MSNTTRNKEEQFRRFMAAVRKGNIAEMNDSFSPDFINKEEDEVTMTRPLHIAVFRKRLNAVRWLLSHGADISSQTERGWLPIHYGGQEGHIGVLKELVAHGADVKSKGENGYSAMHYAASKGKIPAMKWLKNKGCDIDNKNFNGRTPLHEAAAWGLTESVKWLLHAGANASVEDDLNERPIDLAVLCGKVETVDLLRQMCPNVETSKTPFVAAVCAGRIDEMNWILDGIHEDTIVINEPVDGGGGTAMHWAAHNGHVDVMALLMNRGWSIESEDNIKWRPLHRSCIHGMTEAVSWLAETAGCVLDGKNADGRTPIDLARLMGKQDCVKIMEDEQKRRANTEFKLFHLKGMTIVCRKYKTHDFEDSVRKMKENVLPLSRPIAFCDSIILESLPPTLVCIPLMANGQLRYDEYVVTDKQDNEESIKSLVNEIRCWNIECTFEKLDSSMQTDIINLQIISAVTEPGWGNRYLVKFDLQEERSKKPKETVQMMFMETATVAEIKTIFISCMRFVYSIEIQKEIEKDFKVESWKSWKSWIKRIFVRNECNEERAGCISMTKLMLTKRQLMTFYDKSRLKLLDDKLAKDVADLIVTVEQKSIKTMEFILSPSDTNWNFLSDDTLVAIGITDDAPAIAMLRKGYQSMKDVQRAIEENRKKAELVGLVSECGEMKGDEDIDAVGEVVHYFLVERYDDNRSNVKKLSRIGIGSYGSVYGCEIGGDKHSYVVKEVALFQDNNRQKVSSEVNEILAGARIGTHPRVMKWIRFLEDEFAFYIVMYRMEKSLSDYIEERIKANDSLTETEVINFTKQILEGVDYLHDNKIIHRDIKGANILLDKSGNVKLTDFGVSKCLNVSTKQAQSGGAETQVTPYNWMAPEVLHGNYGLKSDIWSVGATVVQMITGKPPFHDLPLLKLLMELQSQKEVCYDYPSGFHEELKQFIDTCLTADPSKRPDSKVLLESSIFN